MNENTSQSLLQGIQARSESAWQRFDSVYRNMILSILTARGVSRPDADDICQNVMLKIEQAIGGFKHNGRVGAFRKWLKVITRNELALFCRKLKDDRRAHDIQELEEQLAAPESSLGKLWDVEHERAMLSLILTELESEASAHNLLIFKRTLIEETPPDQVAAELGITKRAVIVAKSKLLQKARKIGAELFE